MSGLRGDDTRKREAGKGRVPSKIRPPYFLWTRLPFPVTLVRLKRPIKDE